MTPFGPLNLAILLLASDKLQLEETFSFWPSQSGDFAFGFRQIATGGDFLLAIWFNKIPQKTIVWSANRDNLALRGSRVQLTTRGQLLLNDPAGKEIWSTPLPRNDRSVSYAAMLDNGNFVLAGAASANNSQVSWSWQSFDQPTDTILPSQTLSMGRSLVARYLETNYSSGRFELAMQNDGNLMFYSRIIPGNQRGDGYWESRTVGSGFQLVFSLSGNIYLTAENQTILMNFTSKTPSTQSFYHRAILEHDGVFRPYVYPRTNKGNDSSFPNAWSPLTGYPTNICVRMNAGYGGGVCGYNSYCTIEGGQGPICNCPRGYSRVDPNDELKGCKPDFIPQSCDLTLPETDAFEFYSIEHSDWPSYDYEYFSPVAEDDCRRVCLDDCFCAAVIYRNGDCWKKKFPLSFGRIDSDFQGKALIKIRKDNSTLRLDNFVKPGKNKTLIVIGSILLSSSVFVNIVLLLVTLLIVYPFSKKKSSVLHGDHQDPDMNLRIFSYEELNEATGGFTERLGSGAFATVYKGTIVSMDNTLVAVKRMDNMVKEGDQEFKTEVSAIARTNHKNLVRLFGFCNEGQHRLLVYEFMPNGSVADLLFGPSKPNWYQRIQVALGTARGLCYLHEECSTQTIHCDIKPQNILLDDSFSARISDFGLAKLLKRNQTRTMTAIRGTKGYVAPEWFRSLPITVKVDVYSFGILLLELICCRKSFEAEAESEDEKVLADWACDCLRERKVERLVDNDEEAKNDMKRVKKFVMIAVWCIQEEPSLRPTMTKVIQMLEGAVEVSMPPDPSSFISAIQ